MGITVNGLAELGKLAGADLGASDWLEITQERVNTFADATDDHQWIHVRRGERAKDGPFGGTIAHGYLTLALFIPLFTELLDVEGVTTKVNYGLNKVRFPAPVPVGSRIRAGREARRRRRGARRRADHGRRHDRDRGRRQARRRPAERVALLRLKTARREPPCIRQGCHLTIP